MGVAPWDVDNEFGYEGVDVLGIYYDVQNTSTPGDANNLIEFSVSAGTAQGVYNTTAPSGWTAQIFDDYTLFSGNGSYIPPQNILPFVFSIFSTHTNTAQGAANAVAGGLGIPEPFPPLETLVPSEHPAAHVVRVSHEAPAGWEGVAGLGDVRINGVATNELELPHGGAVTVSVQRVVGHPEDAGRRLVLKGIAASP